MSNEDRFITLAIHTYDRALSVKTLLENEGIDVELHNVNLDHPVTSAGVRVRIHERDLPQALRIVENAELFLPPSDSEVDRKYKILVPVDFSDYSRKTYVQAFFIAAAHKADILFVHSYVTPTPSTNFQLSDNYNYHIADIELDKTLRNSASEMMVKFVAEVKDAIKNGVVPPVKFETRICEGIPETVILDLSKEIKPLMIIMGTRGAEKKERELVGSVTAEVLDSSRFSVFTIPESTKISNPEGFKNILFFSNLDQEDLLAIDTFHRLFRYEGIKITIVHVPGKRYDSETASRATRSLMLFCKAHYPDFKFEKHDLDITHPEDDIKEIASRMAIDMILLPNKKRNVFVRFFNPGLAHRLLFYADIPMLAIPV